MECLNLRIKLNKKAESLRKIFCNLITAVLVERDFFLTVHLFSHLFITLLNVVCF